MPTLGSIVILFIVVVVVVLQCFVCMLVVCLTTDGMQETGRDRLHCHQR